ncbi:MAG: M42 family metallopeptidase [Candidatus Odinarchaeia archaeon]
MRELEATLKKLVEVDAPSGMEDNVRELIKELVQPYVDELRVDSLGNLITVKRGEKGAPKILLDAHMDEIGFIVKHIDKKGFIYFSYVGGFFDQTVLNQRVSILTSDGKKIPGVIGSKPPHLIPQEERDKIIKKDGMFIDVGAKSKDDALKMGIRVGDHITWWGPFEKLGEDLVCGKAFDDRLGCLILIETLKKVDTASTLYGVFSVMEEVGLRGARTSAFSLEPDVGIAFDVSATGDYPGVKDFEAPARLGGGPIITVADGAKLSLGGGLIAHPKVKNLLVKVAEENKIMYQLEVFEGGTTDATAIALSKSGVPAGVVSVPCRYIHSPIEVANIHDIENTIKLSVLACEKIPSEF